ncbi:MAG: hypothetical protein ACJAZO_004946, partial [Myxococcota bacterium]
RGRLSASEPPANAEVEVEVEVEMADDVALKQPVG